MKRQTKKVAAPRERAYALAENLASVAVQGLAIDSGNHREQRNNNLEAVYRAVLEYAHVADPYEKVQTLVSQLIPDRRAQIDASDAVTAIMCDALDSGYLYGLAIGRALGQTGGAR